MSVRTIGILVVLISTRKKTTVYQGCDILVGTPGRIMDLTLDNVIVLRTCKKVIDEFDEMLNLGLEPN
jgi:ATP-dependent RNA helicase RhlE